MMDDLISRQAAINAICEHGTELERRGITVLSVVNHKHVTVDLLESLPSAQPTYTDEEIQKMQDLEQAQIEKAYQLGYEEGKKDAQSDHTADGDKMDCISRQAALDAFWKLDVEMRPTAIDEVVKMLRELPSAQPSFSRDQGNDHSAEYSKKVVPCDDAVSRQAAIDALIELYEYQRDIDPTEAADLVRQGIYLAEKKIEQLPSAQPETDIIACGDCKHYICHDRRCGYWNHGVKPLEWCCHAERREEGGQE